MSYFSFDAYMCFVYKTLKKFFFEKNIFSIIFSFIWFKKKLNKWIEFLKVETFLLLSICLVKQLKNKKNKWLSNALI